MKTYFEKNWQHFAVIAAFLILTFFYFSPDFNGYSLKQHDVEQYIGMSNETSMFREKYGKEPLWTNAMFGGMPTTQISILYPGNVFQTALIAFYTFFGSPAGIFLLHLLGFYFLARVLKVRPIIGFIGATAFALAAYEIVIIQAGHNSKAATVALMAPVVASFILAYRQNWKWGAILSGIFMSLQLASNHLQVTYYMAFLLFGLGIFFFIENLKNIKAFLITSASLIAMYLLAIFINYGNISLTNDYAKHTIRGGNDITINPDGSTSKISTSGLDKEYITNWSYGVGESFTLISPYVKGSASAMLQDTKFADMVTNSDRSSEDIKAAMTAPYPVYWGDQPMTSGPVYIGVVMVFLMMLGMIFIKDKSKWVFLGVSVLALMLSWGKNFMGLTDFFIDNVPGYNKFRTVTIIMVLIELCIPVIAVLLLEKLAKERADFKDADKKKFLLSSAVFVVILVGIKFAGLGDHFTNKEELKRVEEIPMQIRQQIAGIDPEALKQNYGVDISNPQQLEEFINVQAEGQTKSYDVIKSVRQDIFNSSMNRSIGFSVLAVGLVALFFYSQVNTMIILGGIALLTLIDFVPVAQNYLNNDELDNGKYKHWVESSEAKYPIMSTQADMKILETESMNPIIQKAIAQGEREGKAKANELGYTGNAKRNVVDAYRFSALNFATNYRVFDFNNPWGSSRTSYFHKSLGGYHGAKLRNIQNLFEFQISQSNNKVLDMLNVKYFIQGEEANQNPTALGNAWLVKSIKTVATPNDEIRALGKQFKVENLGAGQLLINHTDQKTANVYGTEKIAYFINGKDSIQMQLPNGIQKGIKALFVMDVNGQTNFIPEISLNADTANSFTKLASIEVLSDFNPSEEAVMLNEEAKNLSNKKFSAEGKIYMTQYLPNKITYNADVIGNQFAVFSEIYYAEGWKAFVDGKEVKISKVDYLLRGLPLTNGKHKIEFTFELAKYNRSNQFASIGTIILVLLVGFGIYTDRKKKKAEENIA